MENKKIVRLTEQDLHRIIKDSVDRCLNELDWRTYQNAARKSKVQGFDQNLSKPEQEMYKRRAEKFSDKRDSELSDLYDIDMSDYHRFNPNMVHVYSDKQMRGLSAIGRNKRNGDEYVSKVGYRNK